MALTYRFATEADLQQICDIEQEVMPVPWSMKSFQDAYSSQYSMLMVAADDYRIYGFSVLYITAPEAELPDIVVAKEHQGKGIGKELLENTIQEARDKGVDTIFLEVRVSNKAARGLYASFGFEEIGTRKYFYSNPVEDAICMSASI
ncbi:MAG: ribosomal protein S18-alanine N-acetyltransferase [Pseudobutyrivibrio sp.]|nr:ribosomal protein S18-alanine N-acetyltransferase [Pseudobutyrivibrio sp.]